MHLLGLQKIWPRRLPLPVRVPSKCLAQPAGGPPRGRHLPVRRQRLFRLDAEVLPARGRDPDPGVRGRGGRSGRHRRGEGD